MLPQVSREALDRDKGKRGPGDGENRYETALEAENGAAVDVHEHQTEGGYGGQENRETCEN